MARGETYDEFVGKFEPKKTTDDCYTPAIVYDAVLGWACDRYGIDADDVVRPFYPGGDFENFDYPEGCVVLDNPPFSILKRICDTYRHRGIRYFLFAPAMTCIGTGKCAVCASASVTYENGAVVRTSFVTNMEEGVRAMSAPDLHDLVEAADDENQKAAKVHFDKYEFPDEVITAARLGWMSTHHTEFVVPERGSAFIRKLDSMTAAGKSGIFGGGVADGHAARSRARSSRARSSRARSSEEVGTVEKGARYGRVPGRALQQEGEAMTCRDCPRFASHVARFEGGAVERNDCPDAYRGNVWTDVQMLCRWYRENVGTPGEQMRMEV